MHKTKFQCLFKWPGLQVLFVLSGLHCFNLIFCDLLREAAKPPPQPTHRVAVHIPSQQDMDSDSDIEEVRYPHVEFYTARYLIIPLLGCPLNTLTTVFCFLFALQLVAAPKAVPKAAPRGEKVSVVFFLPRKLKVFCLLIYSNRFLQMKVLRIYGA